MTSVTSYDLSRLRAGLKPSPLLVPASAQHE